MISPPGEKKSEQRDCGRQPYPKQLGLKNDESRRAEEPTQTERRNLDDLAGEEEPLIGERPEVSNTQAAVGQHVEETMRGRRREYEGKGREAQRLEPA